MIKTLSNGLLHSEFGVEEGYPQLELVPESGDGSTVRISDLYEAATKIGKFLNSQASARYQKPQSLILSFRDAATLLESLTGYRPKERRLFGGYDWEVGPQRIIDFQRGRMLFKVIGHVAVLSSYNPDDDAIASSHLTRIIKRYATLSFGHPIDLEVRNRPCVHFCVISGYTPESTYVLMTYGDIAMVRAEQTMPHHRDALKALPLDVVVSTMWKYAVAKTTIEGKKVALATVLSTLSLFQIVGCRNKAYVRGYCDPDEIDITLLD